jgi:hypothetical protein
LTQGAKGSAKREALDATLVAFENRLGHMMSMYDVADAPAGFLSQWESTFFKLTGVSSVIDNQRGDAEAMFASHIGSKRGMAWAEIGHKEQRVLQGFGLGEAEWKALHGVEWSKIGERTYLTPSDALKLSDDQVRSYIAERDAGSPVSHWVQGPDGKLLPRPAEGAEIAKTREDLALALATAYSDRAGFAIPMPSARIRAMMFGKNFEPGTGLNVAAPSATGGWTAWRGSSRRPSAPSCSVSPPKACAISFRARTRSQHGKSTRSARSSRVASAPASARSSVTICSANSTGTVSLRSRAWRGRRSPRSTR